MKKNLLLLSILLLTLTTVSAGNRSKSTMFRLAQEHMAKRVNPNNRTANTSEVRQIAERPMMSVYSNGEQFAIIGSDDRYDAVLAYGNGSFDVDSLPANVQWWLSAVEQVMSSGTTTQSTTSPSTTAGSYTATGPIMTTKWSQLEPYNNLMPEVKDEDGHKSKAPCGCLATAMAQILNSKQYPASVDFTGSYIIEGSKKSTKEQVTETFSWPYLLAYGSYYPDGYTSEKDVKKVSYSESEADAIARLMRACGYAVDMEYAYEGSGAYLFDGGYALINEFQYPKEAVKYLTREFFTEEEWMDMLYNEFQQGCPVLYAGYGVTTDIEKATDEDYYGHAFVLHGMDSDGLVYVNWGWAGACDGYYAIDLLHVDDETEFSLYQEAVIGIRPEAASTDGIQSMMVTGEPYTVSYSYRSSKLTLTLKSELYNCSLNDFEGQMRFTLQDITDTQNVWTEELMEEGEILESFYGCEASEKFSIKDVVLESGHTYRAYLESKDNRESSWQKVRTVGGPFYYEISYSEKGKATVSDPVYSADSATTAIQSLVVDTDTDGDETVRYFDLQGREVDADTHGLIIVKQGNTVKKVFK